MKKLIILFLAICCQSLSAQEIGPGQGEGLLSLQQLKDSALHHNMAIRSAQYRIDAAQEQRKEAFTKYFPSVSGTGFVFNANKGMAETTLNPSEMISPELGMALAQSYQDYHHSPERDVYRDGTTERRGE